VTGWVSEGLGYNSTFRPCVSGTLPGRVGVLQVKVSDYDFVNL
jgi:hypothetical protein